MASIAIQGLRPEDVLEVVPEATLREGRKIVSHFYRSGGLAGPLDQVRRVVFNAFRERAHVGNLTVVTRQSSQEDPFEKLLLETHDAQRIEAVRIPLERAGRFSVCVSSQVGCALACAFCATGRLGLKRNLEAWEIVEQVRQVRETLPDRTTPSGTKVRASIHGVVFQGMGEPLANLDRVIAAIRVLTDPCGLAIDGRNITVTTSGLPSAMRRLAEELPKVRLGLSVGSARPEVRRALMPIAQAHAWEELFEASVFHAEKTQMAPLWAIAPLAGHNDTEADAAMLAGEVLRFHERTGKRPRLSLIPYNAIGEGDPYQRQSDDEEARFANALARHGAPPKRRYSGGRDIQAACGQLVAKAALPVLR